MSMKIKVFIIIATTIAYKGKQQSYGMENGG
jgi:hypothetical protein